MGTSNVAFRWGANKLLVAVAVSLFATGCASTEKASTSGLRKEAGMSKEAILAHEDVKAGKAVSFSHPLATVHQAAQRALVFVGCELKKNEEFYISGRRPNKMGLFVGSGGETVEVFLYPDSPTETRVWVDTDLSFVGIAGQQDWNERVLAEIKNILNKPAQP